MEISCEDTWHTLVLKPLTSANGSIFWSEMQLSPLGWLPVEACIVAASPVRSSLCCLTYKLKKLKVKKDANENSPLLNELL